MSTEDAKITTALVDANIEAIKNSFYNENGTISWNDGTGKDREIGTYGENAGGQYAPDQALRNLWDTYLAAAKIDKNDSDYRLDQKNSVIGEGQNRSFQLENGKLYHFQKSLLQQLLCRLWEKNFKLLMLWLKNSRLV